MKKHRFLRTVAACMTLAISLSGWGMGVSATSLSRDSGLYASGDFETTYTYSGNDLGAVWTAEATTFRVWAPTATAVQVNLYRSGVTGTKDRIDPYPMTQDVNGTWVVTVPGDHQGHYYTYQLTVNGLEAEVCDPYARSTGADGKRAAILNLDATDPSGWDKDPMPYDGKDVADAVIYQLNLQGTEGGYAGLTDSVAGWAMPVKSMGATHVELDALYDCATPQVSEEIPVFAKNTDPENFNVPEGAYASDAANAQVRIKELKELIQTIHSHGLSVVMDVDYTHVADVKTFPLNQLVPGYFSRIQSDGTVSNGSGFGNDTATERSMVSKYIADSLCYWVEEYHIDGFRLEGLGLMDTDTVNALMQAVHAVNPHVIFYGDGTKKDTVTTQTCTLADATQGEQVQGMAYLDASMVVLQDQKLSAAQGLMGEHPVLIPDGLAMSADLLDYWGGLMDLRNDPLAEEQLFLCNTEEIPQEMTLPAGEWQVYANGDTAGVEVLDTVQGAVILAPGTAMVLAPVSVVEEETTPPTQPEPTEAPTEVQDEESMQWLLLVEKAVAHLLPYPDLIVAATLMFLSGTTILVVLILKRRK